MNAILSLINEYSRFFAEEEAVKSKYLRGRNKLLGDGEIVGCGGQFCKTNEAPENKLG